MDKIRVKAVFTDIDDTITTLGSDRLARAERDAGIRHYHHLAARNILMRRFGMTRDAANARIRKVDQRSPGHDFFHHLPALRIPLPAMWRAVRRWEQANLKVYADAVYMIRELHARGFPLYTVSNNGKWGTLGKLAQAGLGTRAGSPFFQGFFSYEVFRCTKQDPRMYRKILAQLKLAPKDVVMIGDNPAQDCEVPRQAGICNSIIINRTQSIKMICSGTCIKVKSLRSVPDLLARA